MIMNERIKASEVRLEGLEGEDLGVVSREEALETARRLKADLVCVSLFSSPPPCKLTPRGEASRQKSREAKEERARDRGLKVKELRLTPHIEEHDYETKLRQADKLLSGGAAVQLTVKLTNAKEGVSAKALLERLAKELAAVGKKETGVQVSGKQAAVKLLPL